MFSDPVKNLKAFGIRDNDIVADLGAGSGFYSIPAGAMASMGKVYAVELQKDFLPTIKNKAREAGLTNVEAIWGDVERLGGTGLKDGIASAVIASNILFQVENKDAFTNEIKRILKPGGRVLFIDWTDSPTIPQKNIVPKDKARELFERKGLSVERGLDAGAHHYGMILVKNER